MTAQRRACARLRPCQRPYRGNVADLVRAAAAARPDHPALLYAAGRADRRHDRVVADHLGRARPRRRRRRCRAVATALACAPGDRVALALANTPAFVTAYFAVLRAGLVAVPVNTGYTSPGGGPAARRAPTPRRCSATTRPCGVVEEAVAGTHRVLVDPAGLDAILAAGRAASSVSTADAGRRRRGPRRADVHLRHQRPPARRDAQPPRAAGQPRAVPGASTRRRCCPTTSCCSSCRCSTSTGSTPASAWSPRPAPRPCWPSASTRCRPLDLVRAAGRHQHPGRAADVRRLGRAASAVEALRGVRMLVSGASPLPAPSSSGSRPRPAAPSTRATA